MCAHWSTPASSGSKLSHQPMHSRRR